MRELRTSAEKCSVRRDHRRARPCAARSAERASAPQLASRTKQSSQPAARATHSPELECGAGWACRARRRLACRGAHTMGTSAHRPSSMAPPDARFLRNATPRSFRRGTSLPSCCCGSCGRRHGRRCDCRRHDDPRDLCTPRRRSKIGPYQRYHETATLTSSGAVSGPQKTHRRRIRIRSDRKKSAARLARRSPLIRSRAPIDEGFSRARRFDIHSPLPVRKRAYALSERGWIARSVRPGARNWSTASAAAPRSNLDSSTCGRLDSLAEFRLARGRRPELGSLPQKP